MKPTKSEQISVAKIGCLATIAAALITVIGSIIIAYISLSSNNNQKNNSNELRPPSINSNPNNSPNKVPTPTPIPPTPTPQLEKFTVIQNGVTYQLMEAHFEGNELYFWFIATNQRADRAICLNYSSYLTDTDGNSYRVAYRTAGGERGSFTCFWVKLPNGVPTRFGLIFNTVPPTVINIPLLELPIQDESPVQMKDIPIPYDKVKK
jgi:hypothetical protein